MPDANTIPNDCYSLAEAAILSARSLNSAATSDVLARPVVISEEKGPRVSIRRQDSNIFVDVHISGPTSEFFVKSVAQVVDLLSLPKGWNSYSAKPIQSRNAVRAIELLFQLRETSAPPPIVVPTAPGGIQLEWHANGIDIEVYINSPDDVTFFAEHLESGDSVEQPVDADAHDLKSWVQRVS